MSRPPVAPAPAASSPGSSPVLALPMLVASETSVGAVRAHNEDTFLVEPTLGLFAVFDGMGGANAGDVASALARDAVLDYAGRHADMPDKSALAVQSLQAGSTAVYASAQKSRERSGMGTTAVACWYDGARAIIAHVGDSRAYLLRSGRLLQLTHDHTVVEELVRQGMLTPEEAEVHAYRNVLSRNLGATPAPVVDLAEVVVQPQDRILLCSDGLYGYAQTDAIQYLLGSGDPPPQVVRDLIELALHGGGGDNVTVIVIEVGGAVPTGTQLVRSTGAVAWWQHRQRFFAVCRDRAIHTSPVVAGLAPDEAMELVAGNLCQAVFHDLEKSTGVNVWTYAQTLAQAWFEREGEWAPLRSLLDSMAAAGRAVIDDVRAKDAELGMLLDVAVSRAMVVAELAVGGILSERLRVIDAELIAHRNHVSEGAPRLRPSDTGKAFLEQATVPFGGGLEVTSGVGLTPELVGAVRGAARHARDLARDQPGMALVVEAIAAVERASVANHDRAVLVLAARELYGMRTVDQRGIAPLFDALELARQLLVTGIEAVPVPVLLQARVLRVLAVSHRALVTGVTHLVFEAVTPSRERLRAAQRQTAELRTELQRLERHLAALERDFATRRDQSMPWGTEMRGNTNW